MKSLVANLRQDFEELRDGVNGLIREDRLKTNDSGRIRRRSP